ncbi:hypothetical protein AUJ65_00335 [Candidatus Micrarchaeota archaeon CG1_02_51_15]|nr:MAG: hypothetical protein AUJ65_00335 [Candidatus Micrarchaeota archaeon CG1_02_51_15]
MKFRKPIANISAEKEFSQAYARKNVPSNTDNAAKKPKTPEATTPRYYQKIKLAPQSKRFLTRSLLQSKRRKK